MNVTRPARISFPVGAIPSALVGLALATPAFAQSGSLSLDLVVREAEVIAAGAFAGPQDELGLAPFRVTRLLKRSAAAAPAVLRVRTAPELPAGQDLLLFLVADPLTSSVDGLTPLDPDAGVVILDGRAGLPADILSAIDLELDPPAEPGQRVAAYLRLVGAGDLVTTHAASRLAQDPASIDLVPPAEGARVLGMLEGRRMGTAALGAVVDLAEALWSRDTPAALIALVAAGAPAAVTERVAAALARRSDPRTGALLRDALHRAPEASAPALLRLVGAAAAVELLDEVHARLSASSPDSRHGAIAACGALGQASSLPLLEVLATSGDASTRDAARDAAARIRSRP